MKKRITILCSYKERMGMVLFYSLFPLLKNKIENVRFQFTDSLDYCLQKDTNDFLLIINFIEDNHRFEDVETTSILQSLRDKYKRIAIFDDTARPALVYPDALPLVDVYFKKQLFKDRELYTRKVYRGQLFADYFRHEKGIEDTQKKDRYESKPIDPEHVSRLHLAWNIGVGSYPRNNSLRRAGIVVSRIFSPWLAPYFYHDPARIQFPENRGAHDVHTRVSIPHVETVAFQREEVLRKVQGDSRFLTGFVKQSRYRKEMRQSKIVVSPFGWGEICFRDFEAVMNGALLLKPDMNHIETWPDIYRPGETYVPFHWDAGDVVPLAEQYLDGDRERKRIARRAFEIYMEALKGLEDKVRDFVQAIIGEGESGIFQVK